MAKAQPTHPSSQKDATTALVVEKPQLSKVEFVKVEKNLASLGFFTPSSKRIRDEKAKTVTFIKVIDGKRIEARATIAPAALYGLPVTADQDKYLAFQKFINDIQVRGGRVENPIGFTSADLLRLLGRHRDSGKNYREVEEWLNVMFSTSIISEGTVYFAGQKRWVKDRFHVFDRAVSVGKELPDGTVADRNYVWLSDWQLENINSNYLMPVDLETYRHLKNHIAKALVPLLQIWLYASRDNGAYVKRYDELCSILNLRCYPQPSRVREQFGPSMDELQAHGYLASWAVEPTTDRKAYKIVFRHGEKFRRDRRLRLDAGLALENHDEVSDPEPEAASAAVFNGWVEALHERGVTRREAQKVLAAVPADQPVLDQIEWGEAVIAKDPQKIQNPPGFLLSLVRDNVTVPESFETSRRREDRLAAADVRQAQREAKARLHDAYQAYQEAEIEKYLDGLNPAIVRERLAAITRQLRVEHKHLVHLTDEEHMTRLAKVRLASDVAKDVTLLSFAVFCQQLKNGEVATVEE